MSGQDGGDRSQPGRAARQVDPIDSDDLFWRNVSDTPIDDAELSDQTRALLKEAMFVEPLPFVNRVVFIATPQRGSYLAGPSIGEAKAPGPPWGLAVASESCRQTDSTDIRISLCLSLCAICKDNLRGPACTPRSTASASQE